MVTLTAPRRKTKRNTTTMGTIGMITVSSPEGTTPSEEITPAKGTKKVKPHKHDKEKYCNHGYYQILSRGPSEEITPAKGTKKVKLHKDDMGKYCNHGYYQILSRGGILGRELGKSNTSAVVFVRVRRSVKLAKDC
mmetsp:Transcript_26093/g.46263  ORF Transcript_26093/g.46263 Transcript_26093/m.46263 type:complete len:136 (+) Transcript_26093:1306-1713(+)